jgi:hypothetical protein
MKGRGLTLSNNVWTLNDIHSINEAKAVCVGMIHDRLRPTDSKNHESTIGDQRSLREYG